MIVSIIGGTGPQGLGIGERLAIAGVDVIIGSRKEEKALDVVEQAKSLMDKLELNLADRNVAQIANKEAKNIEKEAKVKANIMLADARNELESLHNKTIALTQQYEKYKLQFKNLAKAQIEMLETDAFSINVARLDAFITEDEDKKEEPKEEENDDVHELVADEKTDSLLKAGFDDDAEEVEFDFSDFEDNDEKKDGDVNLSDLSDN